MGFGLAGQVAASGVNVIQIILNKHKLPLISNVPYTTLSTARVFQAIIVMFELVHQFLSSLSILVVIFLSNSSV